MSNAQAMRETVELKSGGQVYRIRFPTWALVELEEKRNVIAKDVADRFVKMTVAAGKALALRFQNVESDAEVGDFQPSPEEADAIARAINAEDLKISTRETSAMLWAGLIHENDTLTFPRGVGEIIDEVETDGDGLDVESFVLMKVMEAYFGRTGSAQGTTFAKGVREARTKVESRTRS